MNFDSADWKNIEYNHGNHFDGSNFTAPIKGIYSFLTTIKQRSYQFGRIRCYVNNKVIALAERTNSTDIKTDINMNAGQILLPITLELKKDDIVTIRIGGDLYNITDPQTTYFEGRLVSVINE